jgi:hypothetical protein
VDNLPCTQQAVHSPTGTAGYPPLLDTDALRLPANRL